MKKTIRVWVPDDQEHWGPPRAVARDGDPPHPQPGRVYLVEAQSAKAAVAAVQVSLRPEPDEEQDPDGFLAWRKAQRTVKKLDGVKSRAELAPKKGVKRG